MGASCRAVRHQEARELIAPTMKLRGLFALLLLCGVATSQFLGEPVSDLESKLEGIEKHTGNSLDDENPLLSEEEWRPVREGGKEERPVYNPAKLDNLEHENWADMGAAEDNVSAMGHLKKHERAEPCGPRCRHSERQAAREVAAARRHRGAYSKPTARDEAAPVPAPRHRSAVKAADIKRWAGQRPDRYAPKAARSAARKRSASPRYDSDDPRGGRISVEGRPPTAVARREVTVKELHGALQKDKEFRKVKKKLATSATPKAATVAHTKKPKKPSTVAPSKKKKQGHAKKALSKAAKQRAKVWNQLMGKHAELVDLEDAALTPVTLYDSDDEMILRPHSLFDAENPAKVAPVSSLYEMQTELYTQSLTDE